MESSMGHLAIIIIGLGSGALISGAVFAFIVKIGLVTRLAQKTGTSKHFIILEEAIIAGGIFGTIMGLVHFNISVWSPLLALFGFLTGVFYGCLAVSLAETLNVIPIMNRRINLKRGLTFLMVCLALGKTIGSLMYFHVPGFFENN